MTGKGREGESGEGEGKYKDRKEYTSEATEHWIFLDIYTTYLM